MTEMGVHRHAMTGCRRQGRQGDFRQELGWSANRDRAACAVAVCRERGEGLLKHIDMKRDPLRQRVRRGCGDDASARAREEPTPEPAFQGLDMTGDGRLGEPERLGRRGHRGQPVHGKEGAEMIEVTHKPIYR